MGLWHLNFEEATSAHVQKLSFPYGNSDMGHVSTSRNTENFPYTSLPKSVYSRHSVFLVQYFPFETYFGISTYPTPHPKKNKYPLAYDVVYTTCQFVVKPYVS